MWLWHKEIFRSRFSHQFIAQNTRKVHLCNQQIDFYCTLQFVPLMKIFREIIGQLHFSERNVVLWSSFGLRQVGSGWDWGFMYPFLICDLNSYLKRGNVRLAVNVKETAWECFVWTEKIPFFLCLLRNMRQEVEQLDNAWWHANTNSICQRKEAVRDTWLLIQCLCICASAWFGMRPRRISLQLQGEQREQYCCTRNVPCCLTMYC